MSNEDMVSVRLTAAGQAAANGGPLYVHGGNVDVAFRGDVAQSVHLTVWAEVLKSTAPGGKPYFEIVPAAPAIVPAPPASKPVPKAAAPEPTIPNDAK